MPRFTAPCQAVALRVFGDEYQVAASEVHGGKVDMVEEPSDAVDQRAEVAPPTCAQYPLLCDILAGLPVVLQGHAQCCYV